MQISEFQVVTLFPLHNEILPLVNSLFIQKYFFEIGLFTKQIDKTPRS